MEKNMEKRCGITTITTGMNYGNRLQNYAMQKVLKSLGYMPETISYQASYIGNTSIDNKKKMKEKILSYRKRGVKHIFNVVMKKTIRKSIFQRKEEYRKKCFEEFNEKYIEMTEQIYTNSSNLTSLDNQYDFFITGSDQVWNPYWEGKDAFFYLDFAKQNKRIAYAPSFGVSIIPEEQKQWYKEKIKGIKWVSVREEKGRDIIEELIQEKVPVVLDPTFLLSRKEWEEVLKEPTIKEKYLFTYFLGTVSKKRRKEINLFAKENELKIINMYELWDKDADFGGPSEFLGLIKNASYVCTDSFHGAVFSILFQIPFTVLEREGLEENKSTKMNSRIETLLHKFHLEQCHHFAKKDKRGNYSIFFEQAEEVLEREKKSSLDFLKSALEGVKYKEN